MPTKTTSRGLGKSISCEADETLTLGIDTHKCSYHVALWSNTRQAVIAKWVQPADPQALLEKLEPVRSNVVCAYYEAGPTGFDLARRLAAAGFQVRVIAPSHTPQAPQKAAKCDRLDACRLAEFGAKGLLKPVRIPSELEERRRQLVRTRRQIVKKCVAIKAQIRSLLLYHAIAEPEGLKHWSKKGIEALRRLKLDEHLRLVLDLELAELDHQQAQLDRVEAQMEKLAEHSDLAAQVELLRSLPYFGQKTALTIVTEMPEPERFGNAREVSSFQGLAPCVESSGQSRKEKGLGTGGSRALRTALVEAAWRWVSHDEGAKMLFKHYLVRTGMKQKAIVAVARRLGIIVWQMLVTKSKYDAERLPRRVAKA